MRYISLYYEAFDSISAFCRADRLARLLGDIKPRSAAKSPARHLDRPRRRAGGHH